MVHFSKMQSSFLFKYSEPRMQTCEKVCRIDSDKVCAAVFNCLSSV